jgi:hypothetical protein
MSKKTFSGGLNSLLGENKELKHKPDLLKPKRGRPKTQTKVITKSSQEGTKENETRATFIVNEDLLEKLKAIAYWERKQYKEVINEALQAHIDKEKPKPRPKEEREKEQARNQALIKEEGLKAKLPKY